MSEREPQEEDRGTALCSVCGMGFDSDSELTKHMTEAHGEIDLDAEPDE